MNSSIQTLNLNNTNINTNISTSKATTNVVNLKLNSIGINSKNIVNNFSSYNTDSNDILNENGFTEREYTLEELLEESDKYRRNEFIAGKSIYAEYDIISAALSELSFSERLLLDTNAVCSELSLTREKDFETIWEEAEAYRKKIAEKIAKDKKAASNVENIINKIKLPITLDLANDVNNALAAYESLTADQIKYLDEETIQKLEAAKKEIDRLEAEKKAKELEIAQKKQELEDLYKKREANNGIFHPQIEDEIEKKILKLEKELGVPHKPDGFESFVDSATNVIDTIQDYAQTAVVSFTTGVLDVVEGIGDGIIMAGGALSSSVVGIFDEEMAAEIEAATQSIVQYDWTNKIYDETMAALDVDPEIAYGKLHSITSAAGTMVGYAALSMIPGGAVVVAAASGLAAMGSASENAFRNGATFDEALAVGTSNAIIGAISGGATSKIGVLAKGSTSLLQATGYTLAGVGIGAGEPLLNSFVEYATYGNNDGKSYLDFMDQSGGWWNVGIGGGAGGLSTGFQGFKGYTKNKYKADFNTNMNSMDEATRSQCWEEYYKQQYGEVVEHTSGITVEGNNGSYIDMNSIKINQIHNRYSNIPIMNVNQKSKIMEIFNIEQDIASKDYLEDFKTYREHAKEHTKLVTDYAVNLAFNIESIDDVALSEIYYGAYFHDLGMAGGGIDSNGNIYGLNYNKKNGQYLGLLSELDVKDAGSAARQNHALNSALTILTNDIVPQGLDKDRIALLALSHSKSTSGISSFTDIGQWKKAIEKLDDAVKKYNQINDLFGNDAIKFDSERMKMLVSDYDSTNFKKLMDQAICIRDGDAMSSLALTKDKHTKMQTGTIAYVSSPQHSLNKEIPEFDEELKLIDDIIKDKNGKELFKVEDKYGKLFHAGEENVQFNSFYDGNKYMCKVELVDAQKVPNSSTFVINERLGEIATYTNCDRKVIIDLPQDLIDTAYGKSYIKNIEDTITKNINDAYAKKITNQISAQQFNSIKDFYMNSIEINGVDSFKIEWSE